MNEKDKTITVLVVVVDEHEPSCPMSKENSKHTSSGVATDAYRKGWETIFGNKVTVGES